MVRKVDITDKNYMELILPAMGSGYMGGISTGVRWYRTTHDLNNTPNPCLILEFTGITVPLADVSDYRKCFAWFGNPVLNCQRRAYSDAGTTSVQYFDILGVERADWDGQFWSYPLGPPGLLVAGRVYQSVKICFIIANFQQRLTYVVDKPSVYLGVIAPAPGEVLREKCSWTSVSWKLSKTLDFSGVELEPGYIINRELSVPIQSFIIAERTK